LWDKQFGYDYVTRLTQHSNHLQIGEISTSIGYIDAGTEMVSSV